jgi:hypothetical protein
VRAGLVTREGAEHDYGVVFGEGLGVDAEATRARREALARDPAFRERVGPFRYEDLPDVAPPGARPDPH